MRRVILGKTGSVTRRLQIGRHAVLGDQIPAQAGTVVAARVLNDKTTYNTLENEHGRWVILRSGDIIAGALGHRDALHGYAGTVPNQVQPGDRLQILNLGGVLGIGAEPVPGLGAPFEVEVLGAVLRFPRLGERVGVPANIADAALPRVPLPSLMPPGIALVGTSMDSGKTTAAGAIISGLVAAGEDIAAGKLTGVSLLRDVLHMEDHGASTAALFTDFGVTTTSMDNAVDASHALLGHLAQAEPDRIVLEMGDGLFGTYGVRALLDDPTVRDAMSVIVLCASDPVGAWGAMRALEEHHGLRPHVISGPISDSPVGRRYCQEELGLPTFNALRDPQGLVGAVNAAGMEVSA